jgi:HrpA-like RNA helicase
VPQYILDSGIAGNGMIAVSQPRRVAATSLAQRVSTERNVAVGSLVGYSVRFDEKFSPQTRIKYMTDGMIIRELFSDRNLSQYSVVIVDEAHERTLRTDMLLSILKTIQQRRHAHDKGKSSSTHRWLKIIIMSATLDVEKFRAFYPGLVSYHRWVETTKSHVVPEPVFCMSKVANIL